MAMHLASTGDASGALQALFDPWSLPPSMQTEFAEADLPEWTRRTGEDDRGLFHALKRIGTNPLVLAGLFASVVWPVASPTQVRGALGMVRDYGRRIRLARWTSGAGELFRTRAGEMTLAGNMIQEINQRLERDRMRFYPEFRKVYSEFFGNRPAPAESVFRVAAKLGGLDRAGASEWVKLERMTGYRDVGLRPIVLNEGEQALYQAFDKVRQAYYDEVVSKLSISERTKLESSFRTRGVFTSAPPAGTVDTYYPHYLHVDVRAVRERVMSLFREGQVEEALALANPYNPRLATTEDIERFLDRGLIMRVPKSLRPRDMVMLPAPDQLALLGDAVKPGTLEALRVAQERRTRAPAAALPAVAVYSLDANRTFAEYIHSMDRFKHYALSGLGERLEGELVEKVLTEKGGTRRIPGPLARQNPMLAQYLRETVLPALKGSMNTEEYLRAVDWESTKIGYAQALDRLQRKNPLLQRGPGQKIVNWMVEGLLTPSHFKPRDMERLAGSYLYLSTLGGNLSSSFNNLMQTVATTGPRLGWSNTLEGLWNRIQKGMKYTRLRMEGAVHDEAFRRAFPEFFAAGLDRPDWHTDAFRRAIDQNYTALSKTARKVSNGYQWLSHKLMLPFTAAEENNWHIAFESGLVAARKAGLATDDAVRYARQMTEATQFLAGPLSVPAALSGWRGWKRFPRMFTQYPLRLAGLYGNALARGIRGLMPGGTAAMRSELGVLGRAAVGGYTAYELGRELFDVDISRSLAWQGLPLPQQGGPMGAFPFASPFFTGIQALGQAATGDYSGLRKMTPLAVPAGVPLARIGALASPRVARFLGRQYADYDHPEPDGRIPVMTDRGQLVGLFTPQQLVLRGLGFRPSSALEEQEALGYLKQQGETIRALRNQVQEGWVANDWRRVQDAERQWERMFPGVAFPIKPSDVQAIQNRRMMLRSETMLRQLPPEVRGQFGGILSLSLANRAPMYLTGERPRPSEQLQEQLSELRALRGQPWSEALGIDTGQEE
jgi:hypothetical protein